MVGRNDRCPCGSGKKYKKCCESKELVEVKDMHIEELERILQNFYESYPERKDIPEYNELASKWKSSLQLAIDVEMIEAIVLDEFFFHYRTDIWSGYLDKISKKQMRSSILNVLETWRAPRIFIGEVTQVDSAYLIVKSIFGNETIELRRESEKPVSVGANVYCFILPDGTSITNRYLAVSSLIFFPVDHQEVFKNFAKQYVLQTDKTLDTYWKENSIVFWENLGENGFEGGEFTGFETGVLDHIMVFLEKNDRESDALLEVVEDYLVELQPNARKEVAIAAGAIRFGLDEGYFNSLDLTLKEIAEWFEVSTSSMNKYHKELVEYKGTKS